MENLRKYAQKISALDGLLNVISKLYALYYFAGFSDTEKFEDVEKETKEKIMEILKRNNTDVDEIDFDILYSYFSILAYINVLKNV
ncbi:MAG: hypothetical protein NC921_03985 [Candidatus Omnitrophica bacterium]|nr:hypothetical protein [Candidatus Omnitrophota bacterium]